MVNNIINKSSNQNDKYLYLITYGVEYEELCAMEMKYIFGPISSKSFHLTSEDIDISRSVFLKGRINILYQEDTIEKMESKMLQDNLEYEQYKIHYIKFDEVPYQIRLSSMRKLGYAIEGAFAIKDALVNFALTKVNGKWIFGYYVLNDHKWIERRQKPFNYSNALEVRLAKTVLNIAIHNDFTLSLVDPCCGIGTVIVEARTIGLHIKGFEINPLVKINCNANLEHFGFKPDVKKMDMHHIDEHFDIAILDLPYGQFSSTTLELQTALIHQTKVISDKSIIITMEDMSDVIVREGLTIIDSCRIKKSNAFSRYIFVCIS